MLKKGKSESRKKCRERRRRRIEMRRVAASTPAERLSAPAPPADPVFGTVSIVGRSRYMEDAVAVRTAISRPEVTEQRPVHFFAVYDGHGGRHVAELCKERMHVIVEEEMGLGWVGLESDEDNEEELWWRRVMERSFKRMDEEAVDTCSYSSFPETEASIGGSTAVVAVLTPDNIVVANVGDSRAVLCRAGIVLPLSHDHKPDRSDELARIQAAGGRVINFMNGARVEGILAMSRAIGDKHLKPYVISKPEVTFTKREEEDVCLIMASDGLWDVLSNELACKVACECLREGVSTPAPSSTSVVDPHTSTNTSTREPQSEDENAGALYPSCSSLTAALLTCLALGRRSSDNISVIVVDLKQS